MDMIVPTSLKSVIRKYSYFLIGLIFYLLLALDLLAGWKIRLPIQCRISPKGLPLKVIWSSTRRRWLLIRNIALVQSPSKDRNFRWELRSLAETSLACTIDVMCCRRWNRNHVMINRMFSSAFRGATWYVSCCVEITQILS